MRISGIWFSSLVFALSSSCSPQGEDKTPELDPSALVSEKLQELEGETFDPGDHSFQDTSFFFIPHLPKGDTTWPFNMEDVSLNYHTTADTIFHTGYFHGEPGPALSLRPTLHISHQSPLTTRSLIINTETLEGDSLVGPISTFVFDSSFFSQNPISQMEVHPTKDTLFAYFFFLYDDHLQEGILSEVKYDMLEGTIFTSHGFECYRCDRVLRPTFSP